MPQIISVEEVQTVKKLLKEIEFSDVKLGVMVETPAAVQIIKELCEEGIKFISFGTNDLTQYILAIDRGNEQVQHLYNEMHPAVLYQLEFVIRVCKRNNVETSICGQAGSRKEMVKFLVEKGIDSISVNADMAKEISDYVAEIEKERGEGQRQYQPSDSAEGRAGTSKQDWEKSDSAAKGMSHTSGVARTKKEDFVKPQAIIPEENTEEESSPINGIEKPERQEKDESEGYYKEEVKPYNEDEESDEDNKETGDKEEDKDDSENGIILDIF